MKKIITILLCVLLAGCLCACGGSPAESSGAQQPAGTEKGSEVPGTDTPEPASYAFLYQGTRIEMDSPSAPVTDSLGKPLDYREIDSCAGLGLEKTYFYNDFELSTYQDDARGKADCIYSVYFTSDNCETAEGICLGMARSEVLERLGETEQCSEDQAIARKKNASVFVTFQNGTAATIEILTNKVN